MSENPQKKPKRENGQLNISEVRIEMKVVTGDTADLNPGLNLGGNDCGCENLFGGSGGRKKEGSGDGGNRASIIRGTILIMYKFLES